MSVVSGADNVMPPVAAVKRRGDHTLRLLLLAFCARRRVLWGSDEAAPRCPEMSMIPKIVRLPALLLTIPLMMAHLRGSPQERLVVRKPPPGPGFPAPAAPDADSAAEVESTLQAARQKFEVPLRPSRGKHLDAMMARFDLFDVFPSAPVPGHPGADPSKGRHPWERYPEFQSYPGSVEHFRVDEQKYIPPLNPFNMMSLICNLEAAELPGVDANLKERYGEPIVYVPRNAPTVVTGEKRPPVTVVRLKPGGQRLKLKVGPLPWGLYVVRLIACLEEKDVRSGLPEDLVLEMKINDGPRGEVNTYALRQRGTYNFYSMGEFFFRVECATPRAFEIDLGSTPNPRWTSWCIMWMCMTGSTPAPSARARPSPQPFARKSSRPSGKRPKASRSRDPPRSAWTGSSPSSAVETPTSRGMSWRNIGVESATTSSGGSSRR